MSHFSPQTLQRVAQISLGWSMSMSNSAGIRNASKQLNQMAMNLLETDRPRGSDLDALHQMFCLLCAKTRSEVPDCIYTGLQWPTNCHLKREAFSITHGKIDQDKKVAKSNV